MDGFENYRNGIERDPAAQRRDDNVNVENVTLLESSMGDNGGATVRRKFG